MRGKKVRGERWLIKNPTPTFRENGTDSSLQGGVPKEGVWR